MMEEGFSIITTGGLNLYGKTFLPEGEPRAIVCIVHGMSEHLGRYTHVAEKFTESQIGVYIIDLRGHGKSEGKRGHGSISKMLLDVQELVVLARRDFNDLPIFLFGHSMGGNLVANYLIRLISSEISGAILSSPWFELAFKEPSFKLFLGKVVKNTFPATTFPDGLNPSELAHDEEVGIAYAKDPLVHSRISARLFFDIKAAGKFALERAPLIEIPLLVAHGDDDPIVSKKASEEFASKVVKSEFKIWNESKHESHNDKHKDEVITYYVDWVLKQLK